MSKHKGDIEIGRRMAEELLRLFGSPPNVHRCFGVSRCMLYDWEAGKTPGGAMLARLHYYGGDVLWVLTGIRRKANGS